MSVLPPSRYFPPAGDAASEGLVAIGGRLSTDWLVDAYTHGIFPWPMGEMDEPMPWWSPDPRAIIPLDGFHVPRRLRRTINSGRFKVTRDRAFERVIEGCAERFGCDEGTWITPRMVRAYLQLHESGFAHSVEAWLGGELAGGVYGVAIAGLFAAESMFYRHSDASKVALVYLVDHLRERGYQLLDIQQLTAHTERFGAVEISRAEYLQRLADALAAQVSWQ